MNHSQSEPSPVPKEIKKVFVICDNKSLRKKLLKKKIIFLNRGDDLKKDFLGLESVLKETYSKFIKKIWHWIRYFSRICNGKRRCIDIHGL